MPTRLEQIEASARLGPASAEILGNTIRYTPAVGATVEIPVFVDFGEVASGGGGGAAVSQDIEVEADMEFVPTRPSDACRIVLFTIPSLSTKTYKPVDVRRSDVGDSWLFKLKAVL